MEQHRIERLAKEILFPIRANYLEGPESPDRVYEALNALAFATATVLRGTEDNRAAEFFQRALERNLRDLA